MLLEGTAFILYVGSTSTYTLKGWRPPDRGMLAYTVFEGETHIGRRSLSRAYTAQSELADTDIK